MARGRIIKPDIWADEKFTSVEPLARLLFISLWNFADDNGILVNSPRQIRMQSFPADGGPDAREIAKMVSALCDSGLTAVYKVDGCEYILVLGFNRHQKLRHPTFSHPTPTIEGTELIQGQIIDWKPREGTDLNLRGDFTTGMNYGNPLPESKAVMKSGNELPESITVGKKHGRERNRKEDGIVTVNDSGEKESSANHPFTKAESVLGRVNESLGLPPPSAKDVRRHLKPDSDLQLLIEEFGQETVVSMRLWVESNWKGNNKSWPAIYNQRHSIAKSMGAGPPGSPPLRLLTPEEASCDAEAAEVARRHRERAGGV